MKVRLSPGVVILAIVLAGTLVLVGIVFGVSVGEGDTDPVDFDETVDVGIAHAELFALEDRDEPIQFPKVQAVYSQYPFVVGYFGVDRFVETTRQPGHDQQFGHAMDVHVSTFDGWSFETTDEGYPVAAGEHTWHDAASAVYVVDSDVRTPNGETVVPFAGRAQAEAAVDTHGGEVVAWEDVLDRSYDIDDASVVADEAARTHDGADALVDRLDAMADRDHAVVVEDGTTIQETVEAAPAGATVHVPAGTYNETLEVNTSVTLVGEPDTRISGDDNGTVVTVTGEDVAIRSIAIDGVGDSIRADDAHQPGEDDEDPQWDEGIEDYYGQSDAGILVDEAAGVLIEDVAVDSPAAGVIVRDSDETAVRNLSFAGNPDPADGHMGVVVMRSTGLVEGSTMVDGRDGVYLHRAEETVVRDNEFVDNRIGVHLMYTSDAVIADNDFTGQSTAGIYVMTGPERNAVINNEVTDAAMGAYVGGSDSYVAENRFSDTAVGLRIAAVTSIIERNLLVDNTHGAVVQSLLPTNTVTANDFVDNEVHVGQSTGPLRVWTDDDRGNYWEGAVGSVDDGTLDRPYTATDSVDAALHTVDGVRLLAHAPADLALAGVEHAVAGMQDGAVVDLAPRCDPVHADWLADNGYDALDPTCPVVADG